MSKKKIDLTIGGKPYSLQCDISMISDIEMAALNLDQKIHEMKTKGIIGPERVAVLAALDLLVEKSA